MFIEKEISFFLAKKMGTCAAPTKKKPIMISYDVAHAMEKYEKKIPFFKAEWHFIPPDLSPRCHPQFFHPLILFHPQILNIIS